MSITSFARALRRVLAVVLPAIGASVLPAFAPTPLAAQRAGSGGVVDSALSLDSLYRLVLTRSPRIRAANALGRAADARVASATRPADPELQFGFMNYSLPRLTPDPALGMAQLQLMQMIPLPGKLAAAGGAARARADASKARALDVTWQTWVDATMAFYERYQVNGSLVIARESRRLLEDVANAAKSMYRVGSGRQSDVLRADVELARMDEEIIRMETMREVATERLAAVVDTSVLVIANASQLPPFPDSVPLIAQLERTAYASRPALTAGAADVRAADFDAALARRERWPDIKVGVQYGQRRMETGIDRMGSLMIGASLPVFARDRQLRMRDETIAMRQMTEAELQNMRSETRARLADVRATIVRTRRLRTLYRTSVLPQAEAASASALSSYRSGGIEFMSVIEARMSVNRYRQELVALDATEGRAWAELEALTGERLVTTSTSSTEREQHADRQQGAH